MITKWKLFNFKSIRNEENLEFGPLTIFAGSNSSGKSTVLQSMLLISQTLSSKVSSRSVILNGLLTKLGQFDDLRSFGGSANQITFGWVCQPKLDLSEFVDDRGAAWAFIMRRSENLKDISCNFSFEVDPSSPDRDLLQLQPRLFSCEINCTTKGEGQDYRNSIIASRRSLQSVLDIRNLLGEEEKFDANKDNINQSLEFDISIDNESMSEVQRRLESAVPIGCNFRHFLPTRVTVRYNETLQKASAIADVIFGGYPVNQPRYRLSRRYRDEDITIQEGVIDLLVNKLGDAVHPVVYPRQQSFFEEDSTGITVGEWLRRVNRLSPADMTKLRIAIRREEKISYEELRDKIIEGLEEEYGVSSLPLPEDLGTAVRYLETFFTNSLKYLGPLRDDPKPLYPLATSVDPTDIGLRGEYTAAVYDLHKNVRIPFIPTANFASPSVKVDPSTRSLETAVQDWLVYMGVAESVQTIDKGKLGHELKVTTSATDAPQDLTHVGVGVSQVLPILVMCLLANPDTTLIIEQPELHLHPKVQTLLADFFLSMAMLGKQCIIETHSEYIINRLRFRAAAAQDESISSLMKMYFVQKKEGTSVFDPVIVNKYGAITDWPEGFFDQSQREAEEILRAGLNKKKQERGNR